MVSTPLNPFSLISWDSHRKQNFGSVVYAKIQDESRVAVELLPLVEAKFHV